MRQSLLNRFRLSLADTNSQLAYAVLGILSGIACTAVVLAFRFLLEGFGLWLPGGNEENFEGLANWMHFVLPVTGGLILGLVMRKLDPISLRAGTVHVIARLHANNGKLPLRNTIWQFFGGAFALATGQSGGREGPAIHLGAGTNSALGQYFHLPNNSLRILVGCGTAAAIAGSFNTPIAGVIFAMEVVMMEYTIAGFTPIILSAITATAITHYFYGNEAILNITAAPLNSLMELPFIILMGLLIGLCSSIFIIILKATLRQNQRPALQRMLIAGTVTGCLALLAPQIMGVGYDTLNSALSGSVTLNVLMMLIAAKILATAVSTGMGVPMGLIGPNFLIGACIGSAMGIIGHYFYPELASDNSVYVLLGMGAMMGATLNAPLAALMALVELTHNTNIIFPGMLIITVALLTRSAIFKLRSANEVILDSFNQTLRTDPLSLALHRTSVTSLMNSDFKQLTATINRLDADELIKHPPLWLTIKNPEQGYQSYRGEPFISAIKQHIDQHSDDSAIELNTLNVESIATSGIHATATLREALDYMNEDQTDLIVIVGKLSGKVHTELGILSRDDIKTYAQTSN